MSGTRRLPNLPVIELDRRTVLRLLGGALAFPGVPGRENGIAAAAAAGCVLGGESGIASRALFEQIADYVSHAKFEHLPPMVVQKAKEQIVFFFGRAFASVRTSSPMQPDAGAITLRAALAICGTRQVSGRELLLALVLGYEVGSKLQRAAPRACQEDATLWSYGASVAAARLLGIDRERITDALDSPRTPGSPLPESLELGYWEIVGAMHRPYRCPGNDSAAVEMLAELVETHSLAPANVASIEVVLPDTGSPALQFEVSSRGPFAPPCRADSSLPYLLARVLLDGRIEPARLADDRLTRDPATARIMRLIDVRFDSGHAARWTRLAVRAADGREFQRECDFFTCELTPDAWHGWLREYGRHLLPSRQLLALTRLMHNLESLDDVAKLIATAMPALASIPS